MYASELVAYGVRLGDEMRAGRQDAAWWRRFIYSGRDRFLGPAECLELGLIDAVVDLPEGPLVPEPPARGRTRKGGTRP